MFCLGLSREDGGFIENQGKLMDFIGELIPGAVEFYFVRCEECKCIDTLN